MTARILAVHWAPAAILMAGAVATSGVRPQRSLDLREPLVSAVAREIDGFEGHDVDVSEEEALVAGFSEYLLRSYREPGTEGTAFSVYVGYYPSQTQGRTIHSPKNCLPGSGWQALAATTATVTVPGHGGVSVNRYLLQREDERALVLYWYQGRGRVAHNEYVVKWDLLRDATLHRRSDEALVRIVVPVSASEDAAMELASSIAPSLIMAVYRALPEAD